MAFLEKVYDVYHSEKASGKEGAKHVIVFGMIAANFGFTKLSGLTS